MDNHWNGDGVLDHVKDHNTFVREMGYRIEFYNLLTWEQCRQIILQNGIKDFKKPTSGNSLVIAHPIQDGKQTMVIIRPSNKKSTYGKRLYLWEYISRQGGFSAITVFHDQVEHAQLAD